MNAILNYFKNSRKRVALGWFFVHLFFFIIVNLLMALLSQGYLNYHLSDYVLIFSFEVLLFPAVFYTAFIDKVDFFGLYADKILTILLLIIVYYFLYIAIIYYANKFDSRFYFLNGIFSLLFLLNIISIFYFILNNYF